MSEKQIARDISSETDAGYDRLHIGAPAIIMDQRQNLFRDISVITINPFYLFPRWDAIIEQRQTINAVDRIDLGSPFFQPPADRVDQVKAFVFKEISGGCRNHQDRWPIMAVCHQWHLLKQAITVPAGDITSH